MNQSTNIAEEAQKIPSHLSQLSLVLRGNRVTWRGSPGQFFSDRGLFHVDAKWPRRKDRAWVTIFSGFLFQREGGGAPETRRKQHHALANGASWAAHNKQEIKQLQEHKNSK